MPSFRRPVGWASGALALLALSCATTGVAQSPSAPSAPSVPSVPGAPGDTPPSAASPSPIRRADPLDAQAPVPPTRHASSLAQYRRLGDDERVDWKTANDTVARIGGWRTYAREAQAAAAASAAASAAPAASAAASPARPAAPGLHRHH